MTTIKHCPICSKTPEKGDRLVLEYLPEHGHWIMLHLKPITEESPNQHPHSSFPGFFMYCGHAAAFEPRIL